MSPTRFMMVNPMWFTNSKNSVNLCLRNRCKSVSKKSNIPTFYQKQSCPRKEINHFETFYAKRTQFSKHPNIHNYCFNKGLPKYMTLPTPQKQTQYEPNSNPISPQKQGYTEKIKMSTHIISKILRSFSEGEPNFLFNF